MKTLKNILSAALGVMLSSAMMAETPGSTLFYMNSGSRYYKTRFTLASNLMVLPVCINNSDSLHFIFDTGVGRTIITDLDNYNAVPLKKGRKVLVKGLGSSEPVMGVLSTNNRLSLGEIHGDSQDVLIVPNNVIDLSSRLGCKVNGVMGRSVFERFVVDIDYIKQTVRFHEPSRYYRKIRSNEDIIPIELIDGRPYVSALVTINGKVIPVKLLFDTGMSFPLWLDPETNTDLQPTGLSRRDVFGQGLNGEVTGQISRVDKFQIGKFEFFNVISAFPDANAIGEATAIAARNGSVGADIFRRFNVTIDYPNRRIILSRNADFKKPFLYDMSGIEVGSVIPGLPFYNIVSVGDNTPASECGLEKNDMIMSINGNSTRDLSISEIISMLRSKEGRMVRINVKRNGEMVKAKFRLRRLV